MSDIKSTIVRPSEGVTIVTWENMSSGDVGIGFDRTLYKTLSVQVDGDIGAGTIEIQSANSATFHTVGTFRSPGIGQITTYSKLIRPMIPACDARNITVTIVASKV